MTLRATFMLLLLLPSVVDCESRATREGCSKVLDRIVELELKKRGYRDSALLAKKQKELRDELAGELDQCTGKRLTARALECVRNAETTEQITHECLR